MLKMHKSPGKNTGVTLIEILIAMVLGLLLLGGVISMFIANKRIYKEQESMARIQENARFALEMMMRDIRMSGYTGCSNDMGSIKNHVNGAAGASILAFEYAVEGSEGGANWQPTGSSDVTGPSSPTNPTMLPDTDGITVRYLEDTNLGIEEPYMNTHAADLHVVSNNGLSRGEIVGVADCESADIFQISSANPDTSGSVAHNTGTGTPGNATKDLQKKYLGDAGIVRFVSRRYFIGEGSYGGPSLFRNVFAQDRNDSDEDGDTSEVIQHSQELIEGVENMQILYGVDTNSDKVVDTYVKANAVAGSGGWSNVVSVRIALLFRTLKENTMLDPDVGTGTYLLLGGDSGGGVTIGPMNDQHRRRVFTMTIQIRNRSI